MTNDPNELRARTRAMAQRALARGDAVSWFEELYTQAEGDPNHVPWADLGPSPHLFPWTLDQLGRVEPEEAVIVGCGLGDDAEFLASKGWSVTAFDVSRTAIAWCRDRFPHSRVNYRVEDLFNLPHAWRGTFDLVIEVYTLQALPVGMREEALSHVTSLLGPNGVLALATRLREDELAEGPPWPLHMTELAGLDELTTIARERYSVDDDGLTPTMMRMLGRRSDRPA